MFLDLDNSASPVPPEWFVNTLILDQDSVSNAQLGLFLGVSLQFRPSADMSPGQGCLPLVHGEPPLWV